jgi:hypothetical protein
MSGVFGFKFYRLVLMFSGTPVEGVDTSIGAPALSWARTESVMSLSPLAKTTTSMEPELAVEKFFHVHGGHLGLGAGRDGGGDQQDNGENRIAQIFHGRIAKQKLAGTPAKNGLQYLCSRKY